MARYSSLEQLMAIRIPEIQKIFLEVMQDIVDRAMLDEMILAIEANDPDRLFQATGFTPAALGKILDAIEQTYQDSAETTVDGWPRRMTGLNSVFRFDMRNTRVEEDLKTVSSTLVSRLTDEARQNVRNALAEGMARGENPRKTALDIIGRVDPVTKKRVGGIIGLTENQASWVNNAQRYVQTLDKRYFALELRDKRFDGVVKKAIEAGKPLAVGDLNKIITAYKSRALKYRADAVSRTETIQAMNRGEYMSYKQAITEGVATNSQIKKEWDAVGDMRTRHSHMLLQNKYGKGKGIALDAAFETTDGARLLFPGDPSLGAGAKEIVHCRCKVRYRIDYNEGVS